MTTDKLIQTILRTYTMSADGIHGVIHWARVLENGLRLAESTGANVEVVTLFALFHDSRRINDGYDHGHGRRGAEFAASLRGDLFALDDHAFELLHFASTHHTDGLTEADVTVQTCWDADRLDLGRVGITPRPGKLCTGAARAAEMIAWADQRACTDHVPSIVYEHWGLEELRAGRIKRWQEEN